MKNIAPVREVCPVCKSNLDVLLFDRGMKRIFRWLGANNRYACKRCMVTWRRQKPYDYLELARTIRNMRIIWGGKQEK